jgi:hypothetical protein
MISRSLLVTPFLFLSILASATGDPRIKDAFDRLPWVDPTKP